MKTKNKLKRIPFVSLLMPVRNEAAYIREALSAILKQDYPKDFIEIFVIDGNSDDNTLQVISEFQQKWQNIYCNKQYQKDRPHWN